MDIKIPEENLEMCPCQRMIARTPGISCDLCCAESAVIFWDLLDGKITLSGFYRRLRKVGK